MMSTVMTQFVLFQLVIAPTLRLPDMHFHKAPKKPVVIQGELKPLPDIVKPVTPPAPVEPVEPMMIDEGLANGIVASPLLNKLIQEAQQKNVQN